MARWIMLSVALAGLLLAFVTKSPGWLGCGLLLAFVGVIGFVFALASDRIAANARPEASMASIEDFSALSPKAGAPRGSPPTVQSISDHRAENVNDNDHGAMGAASGADADPRT